MSAPETKERKKRSHILITARNVLAVRIIIISLLLSLLFLYPHKGRERAFRELTFKICIVRTV